MQGRPMCHLFTLGQKLEQLSKDSDDVKEFLSEIVDGWAEYCGRLAEYVDGMKGCLHEDPRTDVKLSGLPNGLKFQQMNEDNDDDDEQER